MLKSRIVGITGLAVLFLMIPNVAHAMHIAEGFLPVGWAIFWWVLALGFLIPGIRRVTKVLEAYPEKKMLFAMVGAFMFVLSALKLPSLTGSSSHATGVGLGAIVFGPVAMIPLGFIVLLFQALLLAHGGITTLGANTISMAVVGPFVAYGIFALCRRLKAPLWLGVILGAALGDLATYLTTATQLALAHPATQGGFQASLIKFASIFGITQIPLAFIEGFLTLLIYRKFIQYSSQSDLLSFDKEATK